MKTLTLNQMQQCIGGDDCSLWGAIGTGIFGILSAAIPPMAIGYAVMGGAIGVGFAIACDQGDGGNGHYNPNTPSRGPR